MYRLGLLVIFLVPALLQPQPSTGGSPLDSLKFFVGHWQGTSQGKPGQGKGERNYEFVLGGRFLQVKNKTIYPPQEKNLKGEVHEDIGFYSHDDQRKKFVFRQFHVEGFVNEYVEQQIAPDDRTLVFVTDRIENIPEGWRARETYKIVNQNEYTEVFELARPQKNFELYTQSHWKRVQ